MNGASNVSHRSPVVFSGGLTVRNRVFPSLRPPAASASPELTAHDAAVADPEPELTDITKSEATISQLRDVLHNVFKATGVWLEDLSLGVHPDELLPPRQVEMLDDPVEQSSVV
jgi:hypothetical protein